MLQLIYKIAGFIDKSDLLDPSKQYGVKSTTLADYSQRFFYMDLFRATLSRPQLEWLFYYGLSDVGKQMKPLLEKYSILLQLRESELYNINKSNISDGYSESAFVADTEF